MDPVGTKGSRELNILRKISGAALLGSLVVASAVVPAAAADDGLGETRDFWTKYGVSASVQEDLAHKFLTTGSIDATEAYTEPVSVTSGTFDGVPASVATFADGSISVTSAEGPTENASGTMSALSAAVTGCDAVSGNAAVMRYSGCKVVGDNGIYRIGFKVTYETYFGAANAAIKGAGSADASSGTGTISDPERVLYRTQSTRTTKAAVKYHSDYKAWSNLHQTDVYLGFWLTYNGVRSVTTS
ncbi:hypothetical protein [Isoptericola sp. NPDC056605]|uniref:hypothetical protein n=1 Tax=Isoptericola sp. NPDC056605 TaxID=3345876 RepID=UPI00368742F9